MGEMHRINFLTREFMLPLMEGKEVALKIDVPADATIQDVSIHVEYGMYGDPQKGTVYMFIENPRDSTETTTATAVIMLLPRYAEISPQWQKVRLKLLPVTTSPLKKSEQRPYVIAVYIER